MTMIAPSTYIPAFRFSFVSISRMDPVRSIGRAWTRTATLSATNGVSVSPNTITLYNGMGSALLTFGGSTSSTLTLVPRGGTAQLPLNNPPPAVLEILDSGVAPAATWLNDPAFDDSLWETGYREFGLEMGMSARQWTMSRLPPRGLVFPAQVQRGQIRRPSPS
jgi:hypothetical protein